MAYCLVAVLIYGVFFLNAARCRDWNSLGDGAVIWAPRCHFAAGNVLGGLKVSLESCALSCVEDDDCTHFAIHTDRVCYLEKFDDIAISTDNNLNGTACGYIPSNQVYIHLDPLYLLN